MAVEQLGPDQSWLAWALGAATVGGSALLALVRGESRSGQDALWGQIDMLKKDYVRRDDMETHMAPIHATLAVISRDISTMRDRTHDIAGAVHKLEGRQERSERGAK